MVETVRVISAYDAERMPGMLKISGVGAALGFLGAVGIYFEPQEPYPGYITLAGSLFGVTTALLITTVVTRDSSLGQCLLWGAVHRKLYIVKDYYGLVLGSRALLSGENSCLRVPVGPVLFGLLAGLFDLSGQCMSP